MDSLLQAFAAFRSDPWPKQADQALTEILPSCVAMNSPSIPQDTTNIWTTVIASYAALVPSMNSLSKILARLAGSTEDPVPKAKTIELATTSITSLGSVLASNAAPPTAVWVDQTILSTLLDDVAEWLSDGGDMLENKICDQLTQLNSVMANPLVGESDLRSCLDELGETLTGIQVSLSSITQYMMSNVEGGSGGLGGISYTPADPPGSLGVNGSAGSATARNLRFDGRATDLEIKQVCAFPDQCQMLINEADRLFFTNDKKSINNAAILYARLRRRLAFIPSLISALEASDRSGKTGDEPQLWAAYDEIEGRLTVSAITQLQSIYNQCLGRINRISLGLDMFGHAPNWSPRLSFDFYADAVESQLDFLKLLEGAMEAYYKELVEARSSHATLEKIQKSNKKAKEAAGQRIHLISRQSGILDSANERIASFTPLLKQARSDIKEKMRTVESDIERFINLDMQSLLDAFASVCMAPSAEFAGATAMQSAYKAITTIPDSQGRPVNQGYVISELKSCGNTLQSLSEAFHYSADGSVECDDPGALKIMATADQITSLMEQFAKAIPKRDHDALSAALEDYVDKVKQRNSAVIAYNTALALLAEAATDLEYFDKQTQQIGARLLSLDPNLPAIYYWLQRTIDSQSLAIMEQLNYEGRAISFWSLAPLPPFTEPGPLRGSPDLENNQQTLSRSFADGVTAFARSPWSVWPQGDNQGVLYRFTPTERTSFLSPTKNTDGQNIYGIFKNFSATAEAGSLFPGEANVRLSQVRLWLIGAACQPDGSKRQLLMTQIQHMGQEVIVQPSGGGGEPPMKFEHDAVALQFQFNCAGVKTVADCTGDRIFSREAIEDDYRYTTGESTENKNAPIGPFATWRFQVLEADQAGLDLSGVSDIYVEFCGRNMSVF